ncbi:hypothetical protein [Planococcus sp. ISL-109]|uniref:hypothetical protein n=1 Tax=Planococcus sp. ISL-109 TaxID=2819166 RepID=UPI001BEBE3B9|nr:hypothetical protein [Planococcus sp. ISL-109]MBT2581984.1 hypothetical protein [Planococcus sp. ISL-109]
MRFLNVIVVFLIAFSLSGIALYAIGPNLSTEAVTQRALTQLEESGKMEEMVQYIESDPKVNQYMEQLETQANVQQDLQSGTNESADGTKEEMLETTAEDAGNRLNAPEDETLAFETKEDAAKTVIKKVGFRNLLKMKNAVENDTMTAPEVLKELEEDLNEEEMMALKVMIFKEWQNRN